jgi:hypothetical protein
VLLSSLTPGRCFTFDAPQAPFDEERPSEKLTAARSILSPEVAWKVLASVGEEVEAENARGDVQRFSGHLKVTELPRQGWDRLASRTRGSN